MSGTVGVDGIGVDHRPRRLGRRPLIAASAKPSL
jgi:hypothetical protein